MKSEVLPPRPSNEIAGPRAVVDLAVIGAIVGICYWLVWPVGEYAILDDWAFNKSLLRWHERGELRILHWNPMSLIGHVLWGGLFTKVCGFSFTVTKLSVVVLHLVEMFAVARWLRWCGVPSGGVWLAVLVIMFHPLHFLHCYTFDTDIPAITWQVVGLWCVAMGFATECSPSLTLRVSESPSLTLRVSEWRGCGMLLVGSALLGWSTWTRQHGVVGLLAVGTYLVVWDRRRLFGRAGVCALGPGAVLTIGFAIWYRWIHGPTDVFQVSMRQTREFAASPPWNSLPEIGMTYAVYLGSFVAALAVALPITDWRRLGRRSVVVGLFAAWLMANLVLYFYLERSLLFPYLRNVITPFGVFVPSTYLLGSQPVLWGQPVAWVVTVLSVLGFIALLQRVADGGERVQARNSDEFGYGRTSSRRVTIRLCTLWLACQLAYIAGTTPLLFDRHLLILAPSSVLLFVTLTPLQTRWDWRLFAAVMIPLGYYSLASSHDVHAESRLAFQSGRELLASGVPAEKINGGYAFDGWHLYESYPGSVPVRPLPPWWGGQIWKFFDSWQSTAETLLDFPESAWWSGPVRPPGEVDYVISVSTPKLGGGPGIGPLSGGVHGSSPAVGPHRFREIRRASFVSGWRGRTKFVYVLQRIPGRQADDAAASEDKP